MAKGGARAHSGPAKDPNALRRERPEDKAGWTTLPAEGRKGKAPEWPLTEASVREGVLWAREWRRPQAVMWERNGQEFEVAMYVRCFAEAEVPEAATSLRALVKQQQEILGVSLPGLTRNGWRIGHVSPATAPKVARAGLKVVAGGSG